jgi:hypothetical protein
MRSTAPSRGLWRARCRDDRPSLSSQHLYATYAGHTIQTQEPQLVAAAVDHLLNRHEPGRRGPRPRAAVPTVDEPSVA